MDLAQTIVFALIGGLLPALFWLFFWLREDKDHPEPPKRILAAFILGILSVAVVLPIEKLVFENIAAPVLVLVLWALAEEVGKLLAAYWAGLRTKSFDEPMDAIIYLVSAALGFAAMENVFFLLNPLTDGTIGLAVVTGNIRFIGASLLHVISSASIGVGLALAWRKRRVTKVIDFAIGLVVAVGLHTIFNFFILNIKGSGVLMAFAFVWISVVVLLILFEFVKRLSKRYNLKQRNFRS